MIQQGASEGMRCRSGCPSSICSVKCAFIPQMLCKWIEDLLALPLSGSPTHPPSPPSRIPPWWTSTSPHSQHTFMGSACPLCERFAWLHMQFCAHGSRFLQKWACSCRCSVLCWVMWPRHPSGLPSSCQSAHTSWLWCSACSVVLFHGSLGWFVPYLLPTHCAWDHSVCSNLLPEMFAGYKCVFINVVYWNARAPEVSIRARLCARVCSSETIDPYRSQ